MNPNILFHKFSSENVNHCTNSARRCSESVKSFSFRLDDRVPALADAENCADDEYEYEYEDD